MKKLLAVIVVVLSSWDHSVAQNLFLGPIIFKGQSENAHFSGQGFDIDVDEEKFTVSRFEKGSNEFTFNFNNSSIRDLVFSANRTAIAVAMSASEWKKAQMALITIDASGRKRVFEYQSHEMTERYGWIVELGAVSDNGELILAKCALLLPENNGRQFVRHEWVVLAISENSIKVLEAVNAIDEWADAAR